MVQEVYRARHLPDQSERGINSEYSSLEMLLVEARVSEASFSQSMVTF